MEFTRREIIAQVTGQGEGFHVSEFTINPGIDTTFPWLSTLADSWEYYRFENLKFHFETASGTTDRGSVMLACEYASGSPPPSDFKTIMAYKGAVLSPVYRKVTMSVDSAAAFPQGMGGFKYIRHPSSTPTDRKLYDAGVLMLAVQGTTQDQVLGHLSVSYKVTLHTPQVVKPLAPSDGIISAAKANLQNVNANGVPHDHFVNMALPTVANSEIFSIDGVVRNTLTGDHGGTSLTLPPGTYEIESDIQLIDNAQVATAGVRDYDSCIMNFADLTGDVGTIVPGSTVARARANSAANGTGSSVNLVNRVLAFFNEAANIGFQVHAALPGPVDAGANVIAATSSYRIKQLASQLGF
jgi:hypothetical protein